MKTTQEESEQYSKCPKWSLVHAQGRKLLLLTGPSGCGKTATVRVLAREARLNLVEWTNPTTTPYNNYFMEQGKDNSCRK